MTSLPPGLHFAQPARGYRFNVASLALAAVAHDEGVGGDLLEIGAGVGVVSLLLAASGAPASVSAVEIDPGVHALACANLDTHRARLRCPVTLVHADVRAWSPAEPPLRFDAVVANPPFFRVGQGRPSEDAYRAGARFELTLDAPSLAQAVVRLLAPGGRAFLLYPTGRVADLAAPWDAAGLATCARHALTTRQGDAPFAWVLEACRRERALPAPPRSTTRALYAAPGRYEAWLDPWVRAISRPTAGR